MHCECCLSLFLKCVDVDSPQIPSLGKVVAGLTVGVVTVTLVAGAGYLFHKESNHSSPDVASITIQSLSTTSLMLYFGLIY